MIFSILNVFLIFALYPEVITLDLEPTVRDTIIYDLNEDGKKDILILTSEEEEYNKKILIFIQKTSLPSFDNKPSIIFEVKDPCSIVFITKYEGKSYLVLGNCDEFFIYEFQGDKCNLWKNIEVPNALPCNAKEPLILRDISIDMDNDGNDEWFVPTLHGVAIIKNFDILTSVPLKLFHEIIPGNNLTSFYQYPVAYPLRLINETPKPISFLGDKELVIAYGNNWSSIYRFNIKRKNPEKWDVSYRLGDVNADGAPDILFTETQGTINLRTTVFMYVSKGKYNYSDEPSFEYKVKGAMCLPMIKDINNDKRDDLILFSIPLGLTNFINFFIMGKLSVDTKVFLSKETGLAPKPDYQTSITMDAPEGRDQVAYAVDDFSGDGYVDIAFGQSQNTIAVNVASMEGSLKTKPWLKIDVPGFGLIRTGYIDDNNKKDIIIFRPTGEYKKRVDVILF